MTDRGLFGVMRLSIETELKRWLLCARVFVSNSSTKEHALLLKLKLKLRLRRKVLVLMMLRAEWSEVFVVEEEQKEMRKMMKILLG